MKLSKLGLSVQQLDIGAADAESDRRLGDYFIATPQANAAIELRKSHFLGRKGSGKSSLFIQLPRLVYEKHKNEVLVVQLTPDQYAWARLKEHRELGLQPEQAHANAWKFTIAVEAAAAFIETDEEKLDEAPRAALRTLKTFVRQNYADGKVTPYSTASRLLTGLQSFNFEAFGVSVGASREKSEQPVTPQIIQGIFDQLQIVSRAVGIVIALDRLDDSWDGSADAQSLLIGLLKAAKEVNDRYSQRDGKGISVLVFLRSDIYEALQFDDKDKHRQIEEELVWNPDLLREMLRLRLPRGLSVDELFEESEMRGSISPFNYLLKRTFWRPREVIQFVDECLRRSDKNATEITKEVLRATEERYSQWKLDDLKQEYRRRSPEIVDGLEALRQGYNRYESLEDFEKFLRERAPDLVERFGARHIIQLLFDASAIGVRLGNSGSPRFKCEDSDLSLPASGSVYVHHSLHRGLSIRERRAADDGSDTDPLGLYGDFSNLDS